MNQDFWHSRWQQNQIGFHQQDFNRHLIAHARAFGAPAETRVFVPLAGKSRDMFWLHEQGYAVAGVELSRLAVEAFFAESGLSYAVEETGGFSIFRGDRIDFFVGDFFALRSDRLGPVDGVYDRAALVALPPEMRVRYADAMARLMRPGTHTLLESITYPQEEMNGPPFSVPTDEVNRLFETAYDVRLIESTDVLEEFPRFRQRGITSLTEQAYLLTRRD